MPGGRIVRNLHLHPSSPNHTFFALNGSWQSSRETSGVLIAMKPLGLGLPGHSFSTPGRLSEIKDLLFHLKAYPRALPCKGRRSVRKTLGYMKTPEVFLRIKVCTSLCEYFFLLTWQIQFLRSITTSFKFFSHLFNYS